MIGRTLLQQAVPVTFGVVAAGWLAGLDGALDGPGVRPRHPAGGPVRRRGGHPRLARRRRRPGEGADGRGARPGRPAAALAHRAAADHRRRRRDGPGDRRPVQDRPRRDAARADRGRRGQRGLPPPPAGRRTASRSAARAAAARPPCRTRTTRSPRSPSSAAPGRRRGLLATLVASAEQEHQRAAGAWHAEWQPFGHLLQLAVSAAAWAGDLLANLNVDTARMAANLAAAGGLPLAERVTALLRDSLGAPRRTTWSRAPPPGRRPPASRSAMCCWPPPSSTQARPGRDPSAEIEQALDPASYLGRPTPSSPPPLTAPHQAHSRSG